MRACPVLDTDFAASLNATPMVIADRGASVDSIFSTDPCAWPWVVLENPPAAAQATIVLTYPEHMISVDLLDLLAPRSARLVPDGPWTFTPAQTITLQWSPPDDLAAHKPTIYFVTDDSPQTGIQYTFLPVTVTGDRMTFTLPVVTVPGTLQVTLRKTVEGPGLQCMGAGCQLIETPQLIQHIAWLPAPAR